MAFETSPPPLEVKPPAPEAVTERIYTESQQLTSYQILESQDADLTRRGESKIGDMVVEVINPVGDEPFNKSEANALDYICEQFAAFVASRPIVLEEDTVLPQGSPA